MTADYAVVALPADLEGAAVQWGEWEPALPLTHVVADCDSCDWQDGERLAFGTVTIPPRRRTEGPRELIRYVAFRCPRCQQARAHRLGDEFARVWSSPPRTEVSP